MSDQEGMKAINDATARLVVEPRPPEAFPWGNTGLYRLRVGRYRILYEITEDVIDIGHVDRI
ncbi:type II toxin-antitoxin system RelE family toxin [Actinomadura rupiterrae]|uniref:type II toxin-antitoxin system RelE family toxin n=1 Tax=Actinomadura rupiterrae TaxID=559627 RepID=UPI0020A47283|nr:type II toxin-antitoxin system RelE/ParE family toxin [Actinomadura rupiterrae]MCP2335118.1 mRNA interferase RelE/StbE [Actinomadura rupiterrae]